MDAAAKRSAIRGANCQTVAASEYPMRYTRGSGRPAKGNMVINDQALERRVDVSLMPQVPQVRSGSRREIDSLNRFVEPDLDFATACRVEFGGIAASMHGNPEAVAFRRLPNSLSIHRICLPI